MRTRRHIQRRAPSFFEFKLSSPPWMAYTFASKNECRDYSHDFCSATFADCSHRNRSGLHCMDDHLRDPTSSSDHLQPGGGWSAGIPGRNYCDSRAYRRRWVGYFRSCICGRCYCLCFTEVATSCCHSNRYRCSIRFELPSLLGIHRIGHDSFHAFCGGRPEEFCHVFEYPFGYLLVDHRRSGCDF